MNGGLHRRFSSTNVKQKMNLEIGDNYGIIHLLLSLELLF